MRTDFEAKVYAEINAALLWPDDNETVEVEFTIGLECTVPYQPSYFNPIYGGEPASGPEFEFTYISYETPEGKSVNLTWLEWEALVGEDGARKLWEDAWVQAVESGEF
jgi:hypothetical protein